MKARVITYTENNTKIITGKIEIEIALRIQEELEKIDPTQEHIIYII
jgi:hypothetical protein